MLKFVDKHYAGQIPARAPEHEAASPRAAQRVRRLQRSGRARSAPSASAAPPSSSSRTRASPTCSSTAPLLECSRRPTPRAPPACSLRPAPSGSATVARWMAPFMPEKAQPDLVHARPARLRHRARLALVSHRRPGSGASASPARSSASSPVCSPRSMTRPSPPKLPLWRGAASRSRRAEAPRQHGERQSGEPATNPTTGLRPSQVEPVDVRTRSRKRSGQLVVTGDRAGTCPCGIRHADRLRSGSGAPAWGCVLGGP